MTSVLLVTDNILSLFFISWTVWTCTRSVRLANAVESLDYTSVGYERRQKVTLIISVWRCTANVRLFSAVESKLFRPLHLRRFAVYR